MSETAGHSYMWDLFDLGSEAKFDWSLAKSTRKILPSDPQSSFHLAIVSLFSSQSTYKASLWRFTTDVEIMIGRAIAKERNYPTSILSLHKQSKSGSMSSISALLVRRKLSQICHVHLVQRLFIGCAQKHPTIHPSSAFLPHNRQSVLSSIFP